MHYMNLIASKNGALKPPHALEQEIQHKKDRNDPKDSAFLHHVTSRIMVIEYLAKVTRTLIL